MAADLVLHHARVLTPQALEAQALSPDYHQQLVAVREDRVLAVGRNEDLEEFKGPGTQVIDCQGKTVMPGFNDAHCHILAWAKNLVSPNLGPDRVHSILDIQREIKKISQGLPRGTWIRAEGYNEFYLAEKRHPTRWDLDEAISAHPVKLTHRSGHAHVLNSLALALVGISKETPEPPGAIIERDWETGEPTGLLYDMGDFLAQRVPTLQDEELDRAIKLADQELLSLGITSVQDVSPGNDIRRWQTFQRWKKEGSFKPSLSLMLGREGFGELMACHSGCEVGVKVKEREGLRIRDESGILLCGVKIVLQETTGRIIPSREELEPLALQVHESHLQLAFHALEESTIREASSILEGVLQKSPRVNHRHRIEHCSVCSPETGRRLASLGAITVTQPAFVYYSGERYLRTVPPGELQHLYPIANLLKAGVRVAAGSDCPVVPPNPLIGIYAAITRKTETGDLVTPEEHISLPEALQMYTEGAAYASFEETTKGSITPGKLADLVVLSHDLSQVPIEEIKDLEVEMTIIGGEIAYGEF